MKVNYEAVESRLMIVFEYCDCDLKRFIKENKQEIPEGRIKKFIRQLLTALSVLHDRKIIHRDIKPQNIMLDSQGNIKLADFGLARYVTSKQKTLTRQVQTLWYRAPEVMLGMKQYTFAIDIWAVGCIFAELFLKRPLFLGGEYEIEQIYKVFEVMGTPLKEEWPTIQNLPDFTIRFPKWKKQPLQNIIKSMPPPAIDLLQKMLKYDPTKRITAAEALSHLYLAQEQ